MFKYKVVPLQPILSSFRPRLTSPFLSVTERSLSLKTNSQKVLPSKFGFSHPTQSFIVSKLSHSSPLFLFFCPKRDLIYEGFKIVHIRGFRLHSRSKKNGDKTNIDNSNLNPGFLTNSSLLPTLCGLGASVFLMYTFPGLFVFLILGTVGYGSFKAYRIHSALNKLFNNPGNSFKSNLDSTLGASFNRRQTSQPENVSFQPGLFSALMPLLQPLFKSFLSATQSQGIASEKLHQISSELVLSHIRRKTQIGQMLISEFGPSIESSLQFQDIHMSSMSTVNGRTSMRIIFTGHAYGNPLFDVQAKADISNAGSEDPIVENQIVQLSTFGSRRHLHIPSQIEEDNTVPGQVKEAEYRDI